MVDLPEIFIVSKFHGPDDRVLGAFDCSFQWHRVSADERTDPPAWEETSPDLRVVLTGIHQVVSPCDRRPGGAALRPGRARDGPALGAPRDPMRGRGLTTPLLRLPRPRNHKRPASPSRLPAA